MMVTYNDEKKWYQFALNDAIYVIRLLPVGQHSQETLQAVFTSCDDPDGNPIATAIIDTSQMVASDLTTAFKDIQDREILFLNAAKNAAADWLDAEGSKPLTA